MLLFTRRISIFILLIVSFRAYSGTIKGNITDKQSGEPITGAVVVLHGTQYGTTTGLDGSYLINNVPAGAYDFEIMYASFKTFTQHIDVLEGQTVTVNAPLVSNTHLLEEVEIRGKFKNGSDEQALNIEKNSDNIVNVMSARTIELLPDITVANLMQRVSGVQVDRDANGNAKYATIRGMEKRYNYTTVNGVKIPSPDDKGRYVPLDIFPAEILDRIEVIKTLTPDMEGDAIGGVTNLVMKKAPESPLLYVSAATGYDQTSFDEHFNQFDKNGIFMNDPAKLYGPTYNATMSDLPFASSSIKSIQAPPNGLFSLSAGNRFLKHKQLGVIFSGSYQNTYTETNNIFFKPASVPTVINGVPNIPEFDDVEVRKYSTQETRIGLHSNIDYRINDKNVINLYALFTQLNQLEDRYVIDTSIGVNRLGPGQGVVDYKDRTALRRDDITNVTLKGEHILSDQLKLDWTGAYSQAMRVVPDMSELTLENGFAKDSTGNIVQQKEGETVNGISKKWEKTTDQDLQGFLNLTYKPTIFGKEVEFKAGGMYRSKDRNNYYNDYSLKPIANVLPYSGYQNITASQLQVEDNGVPGSGLPDETGDLTYKVHENIYAYYAQAKIMFLDNRLEALGGVRVEHTHLYDSLAQDDKVQAAVSGIYDYTDVLPSLHLKYKLSKKENLRLSYFESISRPSFYELVNYSFTGEDFTEVGNPLLNHSIAQNFDARYEWYPKGIDQVIVGAFYKNIDDPIEYALTNPGGPSAVDLQPINSPGNAINYGAEFVVTKYFHYFGVSANYTYTHSAITVDERTYILNPNGKGDTSVPATETRPLQGQAAHVGNIALIYKNLKLGLDAHLSAQYTGRHVALASEYIGLDYYQKGTTFLDFSCEKRIVKHLSVYAKIHNLLNTASIVEMDVSNKIYTQPNEYFLPYQNLADGKILVEKNYYGRNYLVGIRYKFD